ncbi:uncharacterized protein LOC108845686 isoform X2 [Raphanus sativus]|uniref:Uncharacterized protein LOC108845686 isoform X2 n=1 Tax=Raphanus sativus TaxID=3726 RepID=A0A9W3D9F6_RAPSA|nr:uncharacterized protein LOC108845686 isoform X2 [Raphanus sativus]
MGKNLRQKVTCSPIQNHPGFMWGLFDILKHNHWRYIKKRLPHKRPLGAGRRSESPVTSPDSIPVSTKSKVDDKSNDSGQRPKKPRSSAVKSKESPKKQHSSEDKSKNLNSEEKRRRTHSEIKRSVKALVKSLVIEDKSKRKKGRHYRTSTYPIQSNPNEKASTLSEVGDSSEKDSSNNKIVISSSTGSLNPLYLMSEESSYSDSEEFKLENTTTIPVDDESDDHSKKRKEDERSSPTQSKACLDALNLIHMNRNFLLKVLQDPGSPLARHFQREQAFSSKTMNRAGSFPATHHGSNTEDHSNNVDVTNESVEKLAADEEGYKRKRGKNHQVVIKRFKDLRQKIKHVIINENKSEKHRITMDAVLDKVPRKYGFSKDLRQDIFSRSSSAKKEGAKPRQIRRTSSLCGSVDRYLQLYEKSFQKSKSTSEKSKVVVESEEEPALLSCKIVPKVLGRILSLPGTKSPYALKTEDLSSLFETSSRSIEQEQDGLDDISEISSEDRSLSSEAGNPTMMAETEQDREVSRLDVETGPKSLYESSVDCLIFDENASESHILRELEVQQDPDTETCGTSKQLESITAEAIDEYLQIDAQDKVKFNYVRDILEISGFNAPQSLSMWQLDYQPLDPLVYQEMTTTGCMIQVPEYSRNYDNEEEEGEGEEGGNCNRLLLFDLINEVLIEIYERSYHYCPKPLSPLCRIHPMPLGYSVLKDVWVRINCYLRYKPHDEQSFDEIMSSDLRRDAGWMDLQFESECVGIELEDLIFEDLLEELLVSG